MDVKVGLLVLLVFSASRACDARELMSVGQSGRETVTFDVSVLQINQLESEGGLKVSEELAQDSHFCTLCEEFVAEALEYLEEDKTQTEIIEMLHSTCSQLRSLEQQCITLVDYYVTLFFDQVGSVEPGDFCQKVNLCEQAVMTSRPQSEDKCEICHHAVAEILLKLKDPDTQLEIIEILLKACNAMEGHVKKCKRLVFEYGPLILSNAEQFLENTDMCNAIHACDSPSANNNQATLIEKAPMLSVM
ncbi:uncharacterized protein LOC131326138 [Rhododendron vialii]|uniref:uncharacterized protein LOC131326138 n=1 Tax=Rhododendron vialii TaxID=182163 RepID=UPI00265D942F|nr:uncharacterized protein LOC131326138 [Rhododendron vialii]XP_058214736.1 uncharacterized protein LOC131326138 [Rhododendron vialii]